MVQQRVYEGTPQELAPYLAQYPERRFRLIDLEAEDEANQETTPPIRPNEKALAALKEISELQKDMSYTDGSKTQKRIREARSGGMYSK